MIGYDFRFFFDAAKAFLEGISPYSISGYFSPFPFTLVMIPFALLPYWLAFSIWTTLNLLSVIALARKQVFPLLRLLLFLPIFYGLWVGQIDPIIIAAGTLGNWPGLVLASLKPQLALWLFPFMFYTWWLQKQRNKIVYTLLGSALVYGIPTLLHPTWWQDWFQGSPSALSYAEHASSIFGFMALSSASKTITFLLVLALGGIVFLTLRPLTSPRYWYFASMFNPVSNIYSLSLLTPHIDWIAVLLSWILLPIAINLHTGMVWALIPIYLWFRRARQDRAYETPAAEHA